MTAQLQSPWIQIIDSNGNPVPGAKIYVKEPGTTTELDVYSDDDASTVVNQPLTADASGRIVRRFVTQKYRMQVYSASDALIGDFDDQDPGLPNGFGGVDLVPIESGGTNARTAAQARSNLGAASNDAVSTAQDDITDLQTAIAPGLNGSNTLGTIAALDEISRDELAAGYGNVIVQAVDATPYTTNTAISTPRIPIDDTTPLISEGTEILTANITPTSSSNKIRITIDGFGYTTGTGAIGIWAIFRGSNCIYAKVQGSNPTYVDISTTKIDSPSSTSQQTYSVRISSNNAGVIYMNGDNSNRYFGGVAACTMRLEEIEAH